MKQGQHGANVTHQPKQNTVQSSRKPSVHAAPHRVCQQCTMQPAEAYENRTRCKLRKHNLRKRNVGISWFCGYDQGSPPTDNISVGLGKIHQSKAHTHTKTNCTSQRMSASRSERPPRMARKGNHRFMGLHTVSVHVCQQCGQKHVQAAGEFQNHTRRPTARLRTKSRANDFPAVPPATAGSSRPEALQGHAERHPASALPVSAAAAPLRSPSASAECG